MPMNLQHVRAFVALVETGSFGAAASRLGISQPTVSQQIRKLETFLGKGLVHRSHAACTPTNHGASILPYARALIASADRLQAAARRDDLVIGASGNIVSYFISAEMPRFAAVAPPSFRWRVEAASNTELGARVAAGELDVAAMEWPDLRPGIATVPWRTEPMSVIVPPGHPHDGRESITVDELVDLPLIGGERGSGTGTVLSAALGKRAQELNIAHSLPTTEAVKGAVRAGLGASVVLDAAVANEVRAGLLVRLAVEGVTLEKAFHLILPEGLPSDTLAVRFTRFLSDAGRPTAGPLQS
jgi:DNA-binding transcriptional LysR family regulator